MDIVTAFCAPRLGQRVFATKGMAGFARASITHSKTGKRPLFIVGSDSIKSRIFDKLARGRAIRFSNTLPGEYWEQVASEKRAIRIVRGKPTPRFERVPGRAAEALDCLVYAHAAYAALSLSPAAFEAREAEVKGKAAPPAPMPSVIRSQWMRRQGATWR